MFFLLWVIMSVPNSIVIGSLGVAGIFVLSLLIVLPQSFFRNRKLFGEIKKHIANADKDNINKVINYKKINRGRKGSISSREYFTGPALYHAVAFGEDKIIKFLLESDLTDVNSTRKWKEVFRITGEELKAQSSCFAAVIYCDSSSFNTKRISDEIVKLFLHRSDLIIDITCYEAIFPYLFEWDSLLDLQPILNDTRFDKNKVTESGDSWLYLAMIDSLWRCNREFLRKDNDGLSLFIKHKKNELLKFLLSSEAFLKHYNKAQFINYLKLAKNKKCDSEVITLLERAQEISAEKWASGELKNDDENTNAQQASSGVIELRGEVINLFPDSNFEVILENKHKIHCHASGKLRSGESDIKKGQLVLVEMTSYDLKKGRIVSVLE